MKNPLLLCFWLFVITVSCSGDGSDSDSTEIPSSNYNQYDFYVSEYGCAASGLTKNFAPVPEIPQATRFAVAGQDLFTFGARKYRTGGLILSQDYSAFIAVNGVDFLADFGGKASSVKGIRLNGGDLYYNTCFESQEGVVEAVSVVTIPTVWRNGQELYQLSGPFVNSATAYVDSSTPVYSNSFGITTKGLWLHGNNIYVPGLCDDFNSDLISYGYWENEVYNELYLGNNIGSNYYLFAVSDAGDIYYYLKTGLNKFFFKNGTDILDPSIFSEVTVKDFVVTGDDVYIAGVVFTNQYQFRIYKNGVQLFSQPCNHENFRSTRMHIEDGKIFIATSDFDSESNVCVYEFDPNTQALTRINATGIDQQSCPYVDLLGFQVVKK